ncbi:MAG: 23S rRNA (uracil(1939)-C(5))-methyltransferase RlmD [Lachnospiraceae bacterium]|nr:23S rRNA (uracil(1939)-C(5))-methyltransferase RlmD [Lachnospiraceae bacterium]
MLIKNQEYEITIEDFGNDGEGIGHIDGIAVFVKDAAKGDRAVVRITKVKKNYAYARLMQIIEPSPMRQEPPCPHAKRCGGCSLMHISYKDQLAWKQEKVSQCLQRIGGIEDPSSLMEPAVGLPDDSNGLRYRNKAQFPVGRGKDGEVTIGFYARHSHDIIDTDTCLLQPEIFDQILQTCREFLQENRIEPYEEETGKGLLRHIMMRIGQATGQIQICFVINGDAIRVKGEKAYVKEDGSAGCFTKTEEKLVATLQKTKGIASIVVNKNTERTNRILGSSVRVLWGREIIEDRIGDISFDIGPLSFYQVNPTQTVRMYQKALDYAELTGKETVWDLYCGIGTISLFLARRADTVCGVEIVEEAIEDARKNAEKNHISNARFFAGKAEEILPEQYEKNKIHADVIVVDPPRKGCDERVIDTMLKMRPDRIVYVSCDPATLARDIKLLSEGGYELKKACIFDNFCQSTHVETIVLLRRKTDLFWKDNFD